MGELSSYPKIYQAGHRVARHMLEEPVTIEEKLDGSQFSFGIFNGELLCRSKGIQIVLDEPGMFASAVATVKELAPLLRNGLAYRGEFLGKPQHNTLVYGRIPLRHIALYDIMVGPEDYVDRPELEKEASRLGLEVVPKYFVGMLESVEEAKQFLGRPSFLGGMAEGIVIKSRTKFGPEGKPLLTKIVTDAFKELHIGSWKKANPTPADIRAEVAAQVCTPARWEKAVQHLREAGLLKDGPEDIGALMKEVSSDIDGECLEIITELLLKWALKDVKRHATKGLPEWYKHKLSTSGT